MNERLNRIYLGAANALDRLTVDELRTIRDAVELAYGAGKADGRMIEATA